jgi:kumamolisin
MTRLALIAIAVCSLAFVHTALAQNPGRSRVFVPASNAERVGDVGVRAHTYLRVLAPSGTSLSFGAAAMSPAVGPPFFGFGFETPESLACVYKLVSTLVTGCNPNTATAVPTGGSKLIAIVDAYDNPKATTDLATFSAQFGLPAPTSTNFKVVYATGSKPNVDPSGGWELEESLDVQWAHAMAPNANIVLVEAKSQNNSDLFIAIDKATSLVKAAGGGEVSSSWGGSEFSTETSLDFHFLTSGVVYFFSSGDSAGVQYPSASPDVVAVGGTTTNRSNVTGNFLKETAWEDGGTGISRFEPRPGYQSSIATIVGSHRGVPDVAAVANPNTGVWVLDTNTLNGQPGGWFIVGGTSAAAPIWTGIVNSAGHFATSANSELTTIYSALGATGGKFNDINYGYCGFYDGNFAAAGWDFCSGVGSPSTKTGK